MLKLSPNLRSFGILCFLNLARFVLLTLIFSIAGRFTILRTPEQSGQQNLHSLSLNFDLPLLFFLNLEYNSKFFLCPFGAFFSRDFVLSSNFCITKFSLFYSVSISC